MYHSSNKSSTGIPVWVVCVVVALLFVGCPTARLASSTVEKVEVHETYTKVQSDSNRYMVNTRGETLVNQDRLVFGKFHSSDVQREIEEGHCYEVTLEGWRIPFLSMYRNIVDIRREVEC